MQKIIISLILVTFIGAQTPDALLQDGQSMLDNNDLERAKMVLEQALQADPTFAPAMILLSKVYLRMGNMDSTKKYINNAIETDLENQEYRDEFDRLNEINTLMADGKRNFQNGELKNAYDSYRIVLEKFPFFAKAAFSMGQVKFREKDYSAAVEQYKKALNLNPQYENARTGILNIVKIKFNEGSKSYKRRDFEGALKAYTEVLELDDTFYKAHFQIGVIQSKMGNRALAIEHYSKALEYSPNFYKGYYMLAKSQKANGNIEGALGSLQSAVDINPGYDKAYGAIGDIYINQKNYDEAISVLNTAIQVNPKYAKGYLSLGIIYSELEQFDSAISNLEMATSLDKKSYMSWYRLAVVYNAKNDCENAKRAARGCTDIKSSFGGAWLELGVAEWCGGKGNKRAAENALEKARNDRSWRKSAEYELDKIRNPKKYQK